MTDEQMILDSDDRAASLKTVRGWVSRRGNFFGKNEKAARWDGCTHVSCRDCGVPIASSRLLCSDCKENAEIKRYNELPKQKWDGETFLYSEVADRYFADRDELIDYLDESACSPDDLRLVICTPNYASQVDPDYWHDDLPERMETFRASWMRRSKR